MSFKAQYIAALLLGGSISSANLETKLTTDDAFLGAWKALIKSGTVKALIANTTAFSIIAGSSTAFSSLLDIAGAQLAASDSATTAISNDSNAIKTVVTNTAYLNLWQNVSANKTRLQARINASGSKLKRQEFTSSGTWTAPGTPIVALSVCAVGGGGNGGNASAFGSGSGGSGAEVKTQSFTSGLPTSDVTVTIGSASTSSSFGAFLSASGGNVGADGGGTITGGGLNSGTIYDSQIELAIWQPNTASKQGGSGGYSATSPTPGGSGGAGLSGSGGVGGNSSPGYGGSGVGSGGGGGSAVGGSSLPGGAASGFGCGGGGAIRDAYTPNAGGAGGTGIVVAYWVEAA